MSLDCPLDCPYLREARKHEQPALLALEDFPNQDVRITESFLGRNQELLFALSLAVFEAAAANPGTVDADLRDALGALIRTFRTRESGLIYETRSANPYAAAAQSHIARSIEAYRQSVAERTGLHQVRDADVLGCLVFLERLERQHNNGKRRGRAFLSFLGGQLPAREARVAEA